MHSKFLISALLLLLTSCGADTTAISAVDGAVVDCGCPENAHCVVSDGASSCQCDSGFHAENLACVADADACAGVTCPDHAHCVENEGSGSCQCDSGFHADALACVADADACANMTCQEHARCVADGAEASCQCDSGFHADGSACVADTNACAGVTCSSHGNCVVSGEAASCQCDSGFHADGLACVANTDPCAGVACSGHGSCVASGGAASCHCDSGYHASGLTCIADSTTGYVVTVGQNASQASSTYFYYDPSNRNAHAVINNAIAAAVPHATASSPAKVFIENASSPYVLDNHIIAKSNVYIAGESRDGARLKIASGITPVPYTYGSSTAGWGGEDTNVKKGAIINIWTGVTNVKITDITFDGSWDDYYTGRPRGKSEFVLININGATDVLIDGCKFTKGADDGILCHRDATRIEVSHNVFNMIGHDCFQNWGTHDVKFHHNVCALRTNSGVRFSGDGSNFEAYANEFYTGAGGGSGAELQTAATNVRIHNNYFHDISGAGGNYGAIGYPGQSPNGAGHHYYNNLIVNCKYGVAYVPSSSVTENNIILNTSTSISGGTSIENITSASGYTFSKSGSNGNGDTYWTVTSGPLTSAFSGIKVGIDPAL